MKRAILIILPLILLLPMVGSAWAGKGGTSILVQLHMVCAFVIMTLLLVTSGCLIIKRSIEERREKIRPKARSADTAHRPPEGEEAAGAPPRT